MDYQLKMQIPIEAVDDVEARQKAKKLMERLKFLPTETVAKLQKLKEGAEPEGIKL